MNDSPKLDAAWDRYLKSPGSILRSPSGDDRLGANSQLPPRSSWTAPLAVMGVMPLLWMAFNLGLGFAGGLTWLAIFASLAATSVLSVVLAREDLRLMDAKNFTLAVPTWSAILPALYLIRRSSQLWHGNFWSYRPLWLHLAALLLVVIVVAWLPLVISVSIRLNEVESILGIG